MASTEDIVGQERYNTPRLERTSILTGRPESWSSRWSPSDTISLWTRPVVIDLLRLRQTSMPSSLLMLFSSEVQSKAYFTCRQATPHLFGTFPYLIVVPAQIHNQPTGVPRWPISSPRCRAAYYIFEALRNNFLPYLGLELGAFNQTPANDRFAAASIGLSASRFQFYTAPCLDGSAFGFSENQVFE